MTKAIVLTIAIALATTMALSVSVAINLLAPKPYSCCSFSRGVDNFDRGLVAHLGRIALAVLQHNMVIARMYFALTNALAMPAGM